MVLSIRPKGTDPHSVTIVSGTLQQVWIALEEKGDIEYTYREASELDLPENESITNTRR